MKQFIAVDQFINLWLIRSSRPELTQFFVHNSKRWHIGFHGIVHFPLITGTSTRPQKVQRIFPSHTPSAGHNTLFFVLIIRHEKKTTTTRARSATWTQKSNKTYQGVIWSRCKLYTRYHQPQQAKEKNEKTILCSRHLDWLSENAICAILWKSSFCLKQKLLNR